MEDQKSVHPALKRRVLEYVRAYPQEAVRIATGGDVKLIKHDARGWYESGNLYGVCGASAKKGDTFRFYLNEKRGGRPGFVCGEEKGSFIYLVQLAQTMEEGDAWRWCERVFPLDDAATGGKAAQWELDTVKEQWRGGKAYHEQNGDQIREAFARHVAKLSDDRRLKYPVTQAGSAILAAYCNADGKPVAVEEREIQPGLNSEVRKFTRWHVGKGVHPVLTEAQNDTVLITVGAWEADQLRELGADAYAVMEDRSGIPDDALMFLAARYSRFVFVGPAGKAGWKWATERGVAGCRKHNLPAEAFEWPAGTPDGYSICRLVLDGGKVRVDLDGAIEVFCSSSALEPGRRKLDAKEQFQRKAYAMVSTLVLESPLLSDAAKLIYSLLLGMQASRPEVYADNKRLRNIIRNPAGECSGDKKIKSALRELQNFSLIMPQERRGYYHVTTRTEILPAVEEKLFTALMEMDKRLREERSRTNARVLDIAPADQKQQESAEAVHADSLF